MQVGDILVGLNPIIPMLLVIDKDTDPHSYKTDWKVMVLKEGPISYSSHTRLDGDIYAYTNFLKAKEIMWMETSFIRNRYRILERSDPAYVLFGNSNGT